jgi:MFS family permease
MVASRALAVLCAADLLVTLDGMVVTVALPAIERDLGASRHDLQWVVTAYTLTLGAFLLVGGRAGDLYGRRRMLVAGLLVFATLRQERERERALGLLSATLDVGMVAGLVLGGVLTASLGWPWCFFVVVPFGLAAAALVPSAVAESRDEQAPPLDIAGAAGAALVAVALALLASFVAVERRVCAPIVRLAVFRHGPLTGANLSIAANAGGFVGMTFMTTLYMQQVLGYSPLEAGLGFLPLALSACAGGLLAPRIVERAGPRRTATASLVVTAAAFLFLARVPDHDGYAAFLLPAFLLAGFTFATAFVPLTSQGMTGVREGERGLASGLFQTSTHLGGAFVLTVLATAAAARTGAALDDGEQAAAALTSGFGLAFLVAAGILALGAISAVRTLPARG